MRSPDARRREAMKTATRLEQRERSDSVHCGLRWTGTAAPLSESSDTRKKADAENRAAGVSAAPKNTGDLGAFASTSAERALRAKYGSWATRLGSRRIGCIFEVDTYAK